MTARASASTVHEISGVPIRARLRHFNTLCAHRPVHPLVALLCVLCHAVCTVVGCCVRVFLVCVETHKSGLDCIIQPGLFSRRDSERQSSRHLYKQRHLARSMQHVDIIVETCAKLGENEVSGSVLTETKRDGESRRQRQRHGDTETQMMTLGGATGAHSFALGVHGPWPHFLFGELLTSCKKDCLGVSFAGFVSLGMNWTCSFCEICLVWRIVRIMQKQSNEFILYLRWRWRCGSLTLFYLSLALSVSSFSSSSSFSQLSHRSCEVVQCCLM